MIQRRTLAAGLVMAHTARAQTRRAAIGLLMPYPADDALLRRRVGALREALDRLGWSSARGTVFEEHWTGDDPAAIRRAAEALVRSGVDIIVTTGSRVVPVVQRATAAIPIIFVGTSDPVGQGFVASMTRPGGNTTGFAQLELRDGTSPMVGKQAELLRELLPGLRRLGLMFNPQNPAVTFHARSFAEISEKLGVAAALIPVAGPAEIEQACAAFAGLPMPGAMVLPSDLTLLGQRDAVVAAMARHRLPAIYADESFVQMGGLASYAADRLALFRRAAGYVDRILRGDRAGELPVQMPTAYALWLHLATARQLGIEVPASLLARADEVME
ncbi:ABC transporter substrate-binding protein [Sediminicoccus sp. KRV36]|uniref:ABC transporter substrate-binding protein n=1 Tax=Sediminicoccus sp. KRV36 TaxID=3133721 RepID=UPI00200FFAC6|nr:ABC transporter substrate-binding protein [Sediminicoccus rosea]UPY38847.1 ABC transporter substrate-binding protein [Sediminicoccus rosea]